MSSIEREAGIAGPEATVQSCPLDEPRPLSGGPMWAANGNDRQSAFHITEGRYWVQEPGENMPGPGSDEHAPLSDLTGSVPYTQPAAPTG